MIMLTCICHVQICTIWFCCRGKTKCCTVDDAGICFSFCSIVELGVAMCLDVRWYWVGSSLVGNVAVIFAGVVSQFLA